MKKCVKCGQEKKITAYGKNKASKDGLHYACKECVNAASRAYFESHREQVLQKNKEKGAEVRARFAEKHGAEYLNAYQRDYYKHNPSRQRRAYAYGQLAQALAKGTVIKSHKCEMCSVEEGNGMKIEAHHKDYLKPLEVMWLCKKCHGKVHQMRNAIKRSI